MDISFRGGLPKGYRFNRVNQLNQKLLKFQVLKTLMNINEKRLKHKQFFTATEFICLLKETHAITVWTNSANIHTDGNVADCILLCFCYTS